MAQPAMPPPTTTTRAVCGRACFISQLPASGTVSDAGRVSGWPGPGPRCPAEPVPGQIVIDRAQVVVSRPPGPRPPPHGGTRGRTARPPGPRCSRAAGWCRPPGQPVSSWLAEAAAGKLRAEALAEFLDRWEAEHGGLTAEELARAERELGVTSRESA